MYCEKLLKKKFDLLDYYNTVPLDTVVHLQLYYTSKVNKNTITILYFNF